MSCWYSYEYKLVRNRSVNKVVWTRHDQLANKQYHSEFGNGTREVHHQLLELLGKTRPNAWRSLSRMEELFIICCWWSTRKELQSNGGGAGEELLILKVAKSKRFWKIAQNIHRWVDLPTPKNANQSRPGAPFCWWESPLQTIDYPFLKMFIPGQTYNESTTAEFASFGHFL